MRKKSSFADRNPFLLLFLAGFVVGVFYITLFGRGAVSRTSLMSPYFFSKYQYLEFVSEELFLYTLKSRLFTFTLLWLSGFTVLGGVAARLYLFWVGAALGITVTAATMKMGFGGILLCIGSSLPHFILYAPALIWVLKKVGEMSGEMEKLGRMGSERKHRVYFYFFVWLVGAVLFLAGAFLESYVNPMFLKAILKKM